jgi:hypothetical protein
MKPRVRRVISCFVLVSMVGFGVAVAQAEETEGLITLACGGIGKDESSRMLALQPAHALTLVFAAADGSYLAGVDTRIEAPLAGLSTRRSCGPIGLVDVPVPGQYRISANHEGRVLEQWVDLAPAGGARLVLRW